MRLTIQMITKFFLKIMNKQIHCNIKHVQKIKIQERETRREREMKLVYGSTKHLSFAAKQCFSGNSTPSIHRIISRWRKSEPTLSLYQETQLLLPQAALLWVSSNRCCSVQHYHIVPLACPSFCSRSPSKVKLSQWHEFAFSSQNKGWSLWLIKAEFLVQALLSWKVITIPWNIFPNSRSETRILTGWHASPTSFSSESSPNSPNLREIRFF